MCFRPVYFHSVTVLVAQIFKQIKLLLAKHTLSQPLLGSYNATVNFNMWWIFCFLSLWTIMWKPSSFAAITVKSVRQLYRIWEQAYGHATSRLPSALINNLHQSKQWRKDMETGGLRNSDRRRHQEKGELRKQREQEKKREQIKMERDRETEAGVVKRRER